MRVCVCVCVCACVCACAGYVFVPFLYVSCTNTVPDFVPIWCKTCTICVQRLYASCALFVRFVYNVCTPPRAMHRTLLHTRVHKIKLKATHRHANDLQKAKSRLTSPLIKTRKSLYVSFSSADGPRQDCVTLAQSVVRRSRFWMDTTQKGVFPCFYADV